MTDGLKCLQATILVPKGTIRLSRKALLVTDWLRRGGRRLSKCSGMLQ